VEKKNKQEQPEELDKPFDDNVEVMPEQEPEVKESKDISDEYLNLARVIQADFDNYRKRSLVQIEKAKIDGIASTVEVLLPSLTLLNK